MLYYFQKSQEDESEEESGNSASNSMQNGIETANNTATENGFNRAIGSRQSSPSNEVDELMKTPANSSNANATNNPTQAQNNVQLKSDEPQPQNLNLEPNFPAQVIDFLFLKHGFLIQWFIAFLNGFVTLKLRLDLSQQNPVF